MLLSYLVVAFRNAFRHRFYALINVLGLTIGLTCAILVAFYARHELSYDRHHEKGDRIYRVLRRAVQAQGKATIEPGTSGPLGPALEAEIPEVVRSVRILPRPFLISHGDKSFTEMSGLVDSSFVDVFTYPLREGLPRDLLTPKGAFVSEILSRKLFDDGVAIGKTVHVKYKWFEDDYVVSGVMAETGARSIPDLDFEFVTASQPTVTDNFGTMFGIYNIWRVQNSFRPLRTEAVQRSPITIGVGRPILMLGSMQARP